MHTVLQTIYIIKLFSSLFSTDTSYFFLFCILLFLQFMRDIEA